jgi:hypothetical protein
LIEYNSILGGPYSHGCKGFQYYPNYQYSMIAVDDNIESTCITFEGHVVGQQFPVLSFQRCINSTNPSIVKRGSPGMAGSKGVPECKLELLPTWLLIIIICIASIIALTIVMFVWKMGKRRGWWQIRQHRKDSSNQLTASEDEKTAESLPGQPGVISN